MNQSKDWMIGFLLGVIKGIYWQNPSEDIGRICSGAIDIYEEWEAEERKERKP